MCKQGYDSDCVCTPKLNSPYLSVAAEVQKDAVKLVITGTFAQLTVVTVSQLAMLGGFAVLSCRLARDREAQLH